ncbi:Glutamyl-tRNA(Gln) amidotransferase subunit F, mitochondrial [Neolecta irregularis DAH-3]|uniref:Glutamyl-tRNA(Gln) amidotransferase subunit F, mitochondrial n=1 Tax=Neolecta irregularis (strain DAH-3) TaxID=1198029 RepID=A0A1U7LI23_NEOID|nr:Glutamyl-tRNA(Gln) amidotransferase subunit F, mitochondrial [Neolecta irregularis DAH-3]|eukprot:OLL22305.1 Glutamyl-tRNA(Gln) amidotransferase subunit F, mitochondrial [Neolecta irregularis DAH-3]
MLRSPFHTSRRFNSIMGTPLWSVKSLLPPHGGHPVVQKDELLNVLKLSALPLPKSPEHDLKLLQDLSNQLHFVRHIQSVDTEDVEPLVCVRDEDQKSVDYDEAMGQLDLPIEAQHWEILKLSKRKNGRFLMVEGGLGDQK